MKNYTEKQLVDAISYWRGMLKEGKTSKYSRKQITEAIEKWETQLDEQDLGKNQKKTLIDYVKKNGDKIDPAKMTDKDWTALSKQLFPKSHVGGAWLKKAVEAAKDGDEKTVEKTLDAAAKPDEQKKAEKEQATVSGEKKDGEKKDAAPVDVKTEKAVEKAMDNAKPEDLGVKGDEEAAEKEATAKPIGEMNLMDRLRRLHNATNNNVIKELKKYLPWAKGDKDIRVSNSCVKNGQFTIPEDGNMFITVKVYVNDANRKGFKKFMAGMFGKAMNETDEELLEGVIGNFLGGLWKGSKEAASKFAADAKEGAQKAAEAYKENIVKVNEIMKKRIGVAAIQEYVKRFCGKALAKEVNYQNIQVAIENEGTEDATYVFTGCIKITK